MAASRLLIINGDDFGASAAVNEAILRAHRGGVLTSASLMVNGAAFAEAVRIARENPTLGVGIHLSLVRSAAALSRHEAPGLVDAAGNLPENPVAAGLRFFFDRRLRISLTREIEAQIRKFLATGLVPTHLDGHLHLQVHPTVFSLLVPLARKYGIAALRLPRESLRVNLRLDPAQRAYKISHALIYGGLCRHARRRLRGGNLLYPDHFFGLLASGRMGEDYLLGALDRLAPGVTEIGLHPALDVPEELARWASSYHYRQELQALLSPRLAEKIHDLGLHLGNYRDLVAGSFAAAPTASPLR